MAHLALYRAFRPSTLDDVVRQEHIVTVLKNQIESGNIGHAYLFCGPRGTGKTSVAKIFAQAINCESPVGGSVRRFLALRIWISTRSTRRRTTA